MSGLLDSIVRRRRASASSRLGPPSQADLSPAPQRVNGIAPPNGGPPPHAQLNGAAPVTEPPPRVVEPEPEPERLIEEPEPDEPAPLAEPQEPQPKTEPEIEPEPQPSRATEQPQASAEPQPPSFVERGRVRRRVRYLRRLREVQLRDLGGFIVELHRAHEIRPELVRDKLDSAIRTEAELRALERALGSDQPFRELREAGIGGVCAACGTVHGTTDRFCSACGEPLGADAEDGAPDSDAL
jgi:hypothetical protein